MKYFQLTASAVLFASIIACSPKDNTEAGGNEPATAAETADECTPEAVASVTAVEIEPGLTSRVFTTGCGAPVASGDLAVVHYTGWLLDESQADRRGQKFDSSRDRGTPFQFPLGAQRVIRGWDQGVAGMSVGEVRELTIAPELAYGNRAIGQIPAGSTLVFEVELVGFESPQAAMGNE